MTIDLYNEDTNELIGSITETDLQVLRDALEEESTEDRNYFIDQATIEMIGEGGASAHLMDVLRAAIGSGDGLEIRWQSRP